MAYFLIELFRLYTGEIFAGSHEADANGGFDKVGALGRCCRRVMSSHIEYQSLEELKLFLKTGEGRISVTLSLPNASGIGQVS